MGDGIGGVLDTWIHTIIYMSTIQRLPSCISFRSVALGP